MKGLILFLACMLAGCAPVLVKNQLTPIGSQAIQFNRGLPFIVSEGQTSGTLILLSEAQSVVGERVRVEFGVINKGETPLNFGLENISVADNQGRVVELVSFETIAAEIESEMRRKQIAAAYMAMSAMTAQSTTTTYNSGTYSGYGNYNSRTYGAGGAYNTYGNAYGSGTYSGFSQSSTVNPAANSAAASAWIAQGQNAQAQLQGKLDNISASYLRTSTVPPGAEFYGFAYLIPNEDAPDQADTYNILIKVGGDEHRFMLDRLPLATK